MTLEVRELHARFAAEVLGLDVSKPLSATVRDALEAVIHRYGVVVLRGQALDDKTQIAFAKQFGELEISNGAVLSERSRLSAPEMVDVSNIADAAGHLKSRDDPGRLQALSTQLWHSDASSKPVAGALSMLFAHQVPESGSYTEFCDLRVAYDELPGDLKAQVEGLYATHEYARLREILGFDDMSAAARAAMPPIARPLAPIHEGSGRRTLFLSMATSEIVGWSVAEGRLLLLDLMLRAVQRHNVHVHAWEKGDLVIWDNRCMMHRGRPYDETEPRDLRRVTTLSLSREVACESVAS